MDYALGGGSSGAVVRDGGARTRTERIVIGATVAASVRGAAAAMNAAAQGDITWQLAGFPG